MECSFCEKTMLKKEAALLVRRHYAIGLHLLELFGKNDVGKIKILQVLKTEVIDLCFNIKNFEAKIRSEDILCNPDTATCVTLWSACKNVDKEALKKEVSSLYRGRETLISTFKEDQELASTIAQKQEQEATLNRYTGYLTELLSDAFEQHILASIKAKNANVDWRSC